MRKQFIEGGEAEVTFETGSTGTFIDSDGDEHGGLPGIVEHDAPWASVAVDVEGGYMVFESTDDYTTWSSQA